MLKLHVIIKAMLREIVLDIDELIIDELGNDSYNKGIYFNKYDIYMIKKKILS